MKGLTARVIMFGGGGADGSAEIAERSLSSSLGVVKGDGNESPLKKSDLEAYLRERDARAALIDGGELV